MALAELCSVFSGLGQALPQASSGHIMQLAMDEADPNDQINPWANRPQRGLLPLPYATFAIEDLPELRKDPAGFNFRLAAREELTMLMVSLLNHEYCMGSRSGCERLKMYLR